MKKIQVFEPPMCCATGVCGPQVDPVLVAFSGFLQQAKQLGCSVERFNLTQAPLPFLENPVVKAVLDAEGVEGLPLILLDGVIALRGRYPDEAQRTSWLKSASAAT